jgi:hypothetical protein
MGALEHWLLRRGAAASAAPWRLLALSFGALMIGLAVAGGLRWYTPVPIGDAWNGMLNFRVLQSAGDHSIWWAQFNEHRIVLARLLFWLDFELFGGRMIFLIIVNYLLAAATVLLFAAIAHGLPRPPGSVRGAAWIWSGLLAGWLFQWMQFENLTRGFQSQFILAMLLPLAALFALYRSTAANSGRWFAGACVLGLASVGSMANGVLALPLMLVYALLTRQARGRIGLLALLAAAAMAAYFTGYHAVPGHGSLGQALREQPLGLLHYWLVYLGGPFQKLVEGSPHGRSAALVMGIVFVLATLPPALRALRRRDEWALALALLCFIAFVAVSALATAGGRLNFGIDQALSSRYTTPALMAWACLALLHASALERAVAARPRLAACALLLPGALMLQAQAAALRPQDAENFEMDVAALALGLGVRDAEQVRIIYPDIDHALRFAGVAVARELSPYSRAPFNGLQQQLGRNLPAGTGRSCLGHLDAADRIGGEARFVRVSGWIFDAARGVAPRQASFVDAGGRVIGLALAGAPRPDVKQAIDRRAGAAGFRGYVRIDALGRLDQPLALQDSEGGCRLALQIRLPYFHIRPAVAAGAAPPGQVSVPLQRLLPGGGWLGTDYQRSSLPGLRVLGSYHHQGDADTGAVEFLARRGDRLLYRSGPTGGHQRLELPGSGLPALVLPVALDWVLLELDGAELPAGEFVVRLVDDGRGWGEWSAIGVKQRD